MIKAMLWVSPWYFCVIYGGWSNQIKLCVYRRYSWSASVAAVNCTSSERRTANRRIDLLLRKWQMSGNYYQTYQRNGFSLATRVYDSVVEFSYFERAGGTLMTLVVPTTTPDDEQVWFENVKTIVMIRFAAIPNISCKFCCHQSLDWFTTLDLNCLYCMNSQ